ncbi:MAG TPA: NADH-quinone oxidoreductase subunit A [Cyclobacteriaceae bacterium]|jgi:NADH-quinone oxidoreductase subunit A|nr:MAG: NADH-quinone oxidoreductase subunit A [Bacteroidota bacterium]
MDSAAASPDLLLEYLPVLLMFALAVLFVGGTMIITHRLGPLRKTKVKLESFECGIESKGNARLPLHIRYFLVAILFVLFDVEVIFMYPWAVNFRDMGIQGFVEMMVFVAFLLIGFLYAVRKGSLRWHHDRSSDD